MKKIKIFCFGFGQVAKAFINKLQNEKYDIELSVTSRGKSETKKFNNLIFHSYSFENDRFDERLIMELKKFDHILISIPPSKNNDIVIKNFSKVILENNLKWITYLSATSVYGDHKGKWVNENSTTKPSSQNGIMRLKAEKEWISFSKLKNLPLQIFRLSGIYSNENNVLKRLRLGNVNLINAKNHFFSRIHVDDIANILFKSLNKIKRNEIFNISDDKPSSSQEVTLYGVEILKLDKPKEINIDEIESEMMRNFYKDSKKIDNKKMKDYFEYSLKYPSYVEGLNDIKNHIF